MGWLFMHDLGGHSTPRAYLDNQFTYMREDHRLTVLASSMVGSTYYAAAERIESSGDRQVFAVVCLTKDQHRRARRLHVRVQGHDGAYGPLRKRVPRLDTQRADRHRQRVRPGVAPPGCRANLVQRRLQNAKPTPKPGQTIVFDEPMRFSDGQERARFEVVPNPKGRTPLFRDPETRSLCRIPAFKKRSYRLINPTVTPASAAS